MRLTITGNGIVLLIVLGVLCYKYDGFAWLHLCVPT